MCSSSTGRAGALANSWWQPCIATAKGVTKVINETAMNADVTSTFVKSTVPVEGANGYTAKDYNVWVFEPAVAYGNAAVLKVTLG